MAKVIITIGLAISLGDACDVFKHGRVSVGVEGLSDTCCNSMSSTLKDLDEKVADKNFVPSPHFQQEAQMTIMGTMMSNCCGTKDQGVLSTLMPEEPPNAGEQIAHMCGMGGPPSMLLTAKFLRISPVVSPVKRASAKQAFSLILSGRFGDTPSHDVVDLDAFVLQNPLFLVMLLLSVFAAGIGIKVAISRRGGSSIDQRGLLG
jgi:hypothetical protein